MELMVAEKPLEFVTGEVTFLVKPRASAADKFCVIMGKDAASFMRAAIERMVVGWKGVTKDGKPVAYNATMLDLLPNGGDNVLLSLGNFILEKTDLVKEDSEAKNALPA